MGNATEVGAGFRAADFSFNTVGATPSTAKLSIAGGAARVLLLGWCQVESRASQTAFSVVGVANSGAGDLRDVGEENNEEVTAAVPATESRFFMGIDAVGGQAGLLYRVDVTRVGGAGSQPMTQAATLAILF